jgi:hypothetical protein
MATTANPLGPWHGSHEGYGKLYFVLCLAEMSSLIAFPWIIPSFSLIRHPSLSYYRLLPVAPGRLVLFDFMGLSFAAIFVSIYRRLSARIAEGAAESKFLDGIRLNMVSMVNLGLMLAILILTSVH